MQATLSTIHLSLDSHLTMERMFATNTIREGGVDHTDTMDPYKPHFISHNTKHYDILAYTSLL